MLKFTLLIFILLLSPTSFAQSKVCGLSEVTIEKTGVAESTRFFITAKNKEHETKLVMSSVDHVNFSCETTIQNRNKILINAYCGGSGCSESTFTVIDARTLQIELVPFQRKGNQDLVEKILGKKLQ